MPTGRRAGGGPTGRSQRRPFVVCRLASSGAIISISVLYRSLSLYPGRTLRSDMLPWVTYSTQSETAAAGGRTGCSSWVLLCLSGTFLTACVFLPLGKPRTDGIQETKCTELSYLSAKVGRGSSGSLDAPQIHILQFPWEWPNGALRGCARSGCSKESQSPRSRKASWRKFNSRPARAH